MLNVSDKKRLISFVQEDGAAVRISRSPIDRILARIMGLPAPRRYSGQPIRIPLRDRVELGADLYLPEGDSKGILLVRGPYGRGKIMSLLFARVYAAQGYGVLFVSSRGTADSQGAFDPMRTEADDGQDVVVWMREQAWYPGRFATIGGSYLGHTQWALLGDQPADLVTSVIQVGPHDFARHAWGTGTFNLDFIGWSDLIVSQSRAGLRAIVAHATSARRIRPVLEALPLADAAEALFREGAPWVRQRLDRSDIDDPYWRPMRHADAIDRVRVPILLLTGWQDIFLQQTLDQYARLRERGIEVGLTIGPWTHAGFTAEAAPIMSREALAWLDEKMAGHAASRRSPVRAYVTGADEWIELPAWPPASRELPLYLRPGRLASTKPGTNTADAQFTYDPANPTPTVGGPVLPGGGYVDDSSLATRADVLAFTGGALDADLTLMGTVRVTLAHSTEHADADLFLRLSEVDARGRSRNVTEGYLRLPSGRARGTVELDLLPTAHRFRKGNCIRLLVAGGSFPQFARNPGTGVNPLTTTELVPNLHTVSHSGGASFVSLPIVDK